MPLEKHSDCCCSGSIHFVAAWLRKNSFQNKPTYCYTNNHATFYNSIVTLKYKVLNLILSMIHLNFILSVLFIIIAEIMCYGWVNIKACIWHFHDTKMWNLQKKTVNSSVTKHRKLKNFHLSSSSFIPEKIMITLNFMYWIYGEWNACVGVLNLECLGRNSQVLPRVCLRQLKAGTESYWWATPCLTFNPSHCMQGCCSATQC